MPKILSRETFGPAGDINLYRSAADILKTDDTMHVVGQNSVALKCEQGGNNGFLTGAQVAFGYGAGSGGLYQHRINSRHSSSQPAEGYLDFYMFAPGTDATTALGTKHVMTLRGNGWLGLNGVTAPGAALNLPADTVASGGLLFGTDTNLYRSAANVLRTDDSLALGTNPAAAGILRLPTTQAVMWRKNDNTGDGPYIASDAGDSLQFITPTWHRFLVGASELLTLRSTVLLANVPLDLRQNEAQQLVTHKLAAVPATPVTGQRYHDTVMKAERFWDGTNWTTIADQTAVSTAAPAGTLNTGDLWYDTDEPNVGLTLPLSVANGGTGAASAPAARTTLAMPGEELAYDQITASVTIASTNVNAQTAVIAGTARTYDGSPIIIEFYSPRVDSPNGGQTLIHLSDGATNLGYFVLALSNSGSQGFATTAVRRITPSPGTHTYNVTGWYGGGTGTGLVTAGLGNANNVYSPAFLRITRA